MEELPDDTEGGLWSTFFPVEKKNTTKVRGCLDLRPLSRHLRYEHFKMEGLHTVRDLLRRRDFMTKVDMSDYFFHLPIKPEDRKYFRFMWQGKKYQCTAMPFGLAQPPGWQRRFCSPSSGTSGRWEYGWLSTSTTCSCSLAAKRRASGTPSC